MEGIRARSTYSEKNKRTNTTAFTSKTRGDTYGPPAEPMARESGPIFRAGEPQDGTARTVKERSGRHLREGSCRRSALTAAETCRHTPCPPTSHRELRWDFGTRREPAAYRGWVVTLSAGGRFGSYEIIDPLGGYEISAPSASGADIKDRS